MGASFQPLMGIIRFGPYHRDWRMQDPWAGCVNWMADLYRYDLCHLFSVGGKVAIRDRKDVLALCRDMGFARMQETRNGQLIVNDLVTMKRSRA